jgi:hypothetical protein
MSNFTVEDIKLLVGRLNQLSGFNSINVIQKKEGTYHFDEFFGREYTVSKIDKEGVKLAVVSEKTTEDTYLKLCEYVEAYREKYKLPPLIRKF